MRITPPGPGIHYDVPAEVYHSWDAINATNLKIIVDESPKHFKHQWDNPKAPTEAMRRGSVLHKLALEPIDFNAEYAVAPKCDKRTKDGKAMWAAFEAKSQGRIVIQQDEYELACQQAHAIERHRTAKKFLTGGHTEVSIVWRDQESGVLCKSRLDYINLFVIVDLKTCQSANPEQFAKSVWNFSYHFSAAMYSEAFRAVVGKPASFVWVAVEKEPPFDVVVYEASQSVLERGRYEFAKALHFYKNCRDSGIWNGYSDGLETLELPAWAAEQEMAI